MAIAPVPASAASAWPRAATTSAASSSDKIPATYAAAISPCECPATAAGTTPSHRHTAASAAITVNSTGCTTSGRSSTGAPGACRQHSLTRHPSSGSSTRSHAAT